MLPLAILFTIVGIFWLGKASGRIEAYNAMLNYLTNMRRELPTEDKLQFDRWFADYNTKYYPNAPKIGAKK